MKGINNMYKIEDFAMLSPMKYYNNEDISNAKRQDMINNKNNLYIASEKQKIIHQK